MTQGNKHNFHQPLEKRWVSCETAEKSNTQTNMPGKIAGQFKQDWQE